MDDFEFDFESNLDANDGQPVEAPSTLPAAVRKNYRQVRVLLRLWARVTMAFKHFSFR